MTNRPGAVVMCALLLVVAALYWLPAHVAAATGWYVPAVNAVVDSLERTGLWLAVAAGLAWRQWSRPAAPMALWAASEAAMGAAARLAFPMCCPLNLPDRDVPLAVHAWGEWTQWVSLLLAAAALWWAVVQLRERPTNEVAHDHPRN